MSRPLRFGHGRAWIRCWALLLAALATAAGFAQQDGEAPPPLAPLPELAKPPDSKQVEIGKLLFFDGRLSGDATLSCAKCHDPGKGWTDGMPLSIGYPGALYFRNTPTVVNAVHSRYLYWDGRLPGTDVPTLVRDHISEAHFMQADGRLVIEKLRQVPAYEEGFQEAFGGEPTYGRVLNAVTAYLQTLRSRDVPLDNYLRGDEGALSDEAKRGLQLFRGKAGCLQCHHGPLLSDGRFHRLGLPPNREVFRTPQRHITYRRFLKTLGVARYVQLREDVGRYAITKKADDHGRFRTPTLREVAGTAPYMHDGSLETLAAVVDFYDQGGGPGEDKDELLKPLGLSDQEKNDLLAFLQSLSGAPIEVEPPALPPYAVRTRGEN